ncbi:trichoplein keratin filament-binding protein isoform X1 [Hemicordylus capensis]|uniref:trichoplein keratin filament-binding protein isoform X1 n=2 Tax=Hemicordylus capensis TaxID=884348 RepID=UPI002302306C|nr:trichoplein keratin filament-binding protein isoform X1 [Hemicordylus capensis]
MEFEGHDVTARGLAVTSCSDEHGFPAAMALPTIPSFWSSRCRTVEQQIARHREQEARFRQKWELNSRYFQQSGVYSSKQAQWNSRQSYQQSMEAYRREKQKEEKQSSLEQRRRRLQKLLLEEREMLAEELRELRLSKEAGLSPMREKSEALKSAREERRKQVAEELLHECWKNNSAKLRQVGSDLHKQHVVEAWGDQLVQKKQQEAAEREEKIRVENQYEAARREALERMEVAAEKRKQEEKQQADFLWQQMEELKLREVEATKLKEEEAKLRKQHWELEALEAERKQQEQARKKRELGRFLKHQYHGQLRRRAQQVQEELEQDRQILLALSEEAEAEDQRLHTLRREQAVAAVAWMKEVLEKQLQLEREREAELETVFREEAKQVWAKREEEWARERKARDRLMAEVLAERAGQIQEKMERNRQAQEESVQCREQLIQELEEAKQLTQRETEEQAVLKTARKAELEAQLTEWQRQQQQEREQLQEEEAAARWAEQHHEEQEQLEARRMAERGYRHQNYSYPRTAWT